MTVAIARKMPAVRWINGKMTLMTDDLSLRQLILDTRKNVMLFGRTFMRQAMSDLPTEQHMEAGRMFDDECSPRTALCAYRSFGKSTTFNALAVQSICYHKYPFILYVGASHDLASQQTEDIKAELLDNDSITEVFGKYTATAYVGSMRMSFSKKGYVICDPWTGEPYCYVMPKGAGQKVRGLNIRLGGAKVRPGLVCVDDLEDDEEVLNPENRKKLRAWFFGALQNVVPRKRPITSGTYRDRWYPNQDPDWTPPWRIVVLDTLKHQDALIGKLMSQPEWNRCRLPKAVLNEEDGQYYSASKPLFSDADVRHEIEQARRNGYFDVYSREYLCTATDPEDKRWNTSMFQHYSEASWNISDDPGWFKCINIDPARSMGKKSAYTGMLAWAVNPLGAKIAFRKELMQRLSPAEIMQALFKLCDETGTSTIAVEITGLGEWVKSWMMNACAQEGRFYEFIWLNSGTLPRSGNYGSDPDAIKRARADLLQPLYASSEGFPKGHVYHSEEMRGGLLEEHLCSAPDLSYWDLVDSAAFCPAVMQAKHLVFAPQAVGGSTVNYEALRLKHQNIIRSRRWAAV